MRKRIISWAAALLALFPRLCAAGSAGADPFDFLFLDAGARAVGMGGAYTALASDANALLYNPAGLAGVLRPEATFMHNQYLQGVGQEYVGVALRRGLGAALSFVRSGNVPRTTISNPDGTGLGSAGLTDLALSAGYGRRIGGPLALGAAGKMIHESIDGFSRTGFALDLGAAYAVRAAPGLRLGAALQNVGPDVRAQGGRERLPLNARLGCAYGFSVKGSESVVSLDVTKERSEGMLVAFGAEAVVAGQMPVRFGFSTRNSAGTGVTAGLGWRFSDASLDYAFVPFGDLGAAHRFSMTYRWGGSRRETAPAPGRFSSEFNAIPALPPTTPARTVPAGVSTRTPASPSPEPAAAPAPLPAQPAVVAQVLVFGLQRVQESAVRALLSVREGAVYPEEDRTKDVAALRASGLFSAAYIVAAHLTGDTVRVDVTLVEK